MADDLPLGLEASRLLALLQGAEQAPVIHVTSGEGRAEELARFVAGAAPGLGVAVFPPWDCLPYDWASPSPEVMGRRMSVLRRLASGEALRLIVTTPAALLQRVPPVGAAPSLAIREGDAVDPDALRRFCVSAGYVVDERVDEPGEVAVRGRAVDIFPAAQDLPFRLELGEGRVEAVRRFDPVTQLTVDKVETLLIDAVSELPAGEEAEEDERPRGAEHWLPQAHPDLATLPDHLPGARLVTSRAAELAREAAMSQIREAYEERAREEVGGEQERRPLPPERLYLTAEDWEQLAAERRLSVLEEGRHEPVPALAEAARTRTALAGFLKEQAEAGRRILLVSGTSRDRDRLHRRVREAKGQAPTAVDSWEAALSAGPGSLLSLDAVLEHGFVEPAAGLAVVTARDVLGSQAEGVPGAASAEVTWMAQGAEFRRGDLVVHLDHGVARLEGLEPLDAGPDGGEMIRLVYADDQVLLVPAAEADKLWRYGSAEGEVPLDRLNTAGWEKRRAKVGEGIAEAARSLIAASAERAERAAPKLVADRARYERLAARFPFDETPDQARAIRALQEDLASGRPMNRLLIGDVGFGKTEVALRAAAICATAGRQVAVVAPTTVLARQHFATFRRRFEGLGVEVAHLSRLVDPKEARAVKAGLAEGRIQVVVGTQSLLGKGVAFHDLALVVVDEEQRLGAEHKRRLRALAEDAHLLTMTATPIPRTLQSALVGLQDMSVLTTPPARRRPVRTFVARHEPPTLRQALLRERRRGGQSFVVVPRVEDIEGTAQELRDLVPRLKVRVAHGELPAQEIDEVMVGFAEGRGDVLLATSIIESGLDVPRANTMMVLRPDLFGLAQLHQLRGRVGRSHAQAYCYLLTGDEELSPATERRLGSLQALDRLGAGLEISAQDLDIRGGGDLFGDRQSGHVKLIGLALYQSLLADALRAARGEEVAQAGVEVQLEALGTLPPDYIPEPEVRLNLYHRLARTREAGDVERLSREVADRFGPPPPPVEDLLRAAAIRVAALSLGVSRISAGPMAVALGFASGAVPEDSLADAREALGDGVEWDGERLILHRPSEDAETQARTVLDLLEALAG